MSTMTKPIKLLIDIMIVFAVSGLAFFLEDVANTQGWVSMSDGARGVSAVLAGAFAAVGVVCMIMLVVAVKPVDDLQSPLGAFIDDAIAQQQFKPGYGNSPLSFWGQYPELAAWGKPAAGLLYCLFCLALAFLPRRIDFSRLIALTAAVLVGTQLVLSFGGGTYIGFYLAPLTLTLFGNQCPKAAEGSSAWAR